MRRDDGQDSRWDYVVVGAGAIGGTVGARLVRSGKSILFCDNSSEVTAALNAKGIHVTGPIEDFAVRARAVIPAELPPVISRVLLCVKAQHTQAALAEIAPRLAPDGFVVSLQNGLNERAIAAAIGPERVVGGFVNFGADYLGDGRILFGGHGAFFIGELEGDITARVNGVVADIAYSQPTSNILGFLWAKLAYVAILAATAVSDLSIAAALDEQRYRQLFIALAREVLSVADAVPEPFDGFDPMDIEGSIARLAAFNRASGKTHSGIYRDLAIRHRPVEVDALLGHVDRPLVRRTHELIAEIERGERQCTRANLDLLAKAATRRLGDGPNTA